MKNISMKMKIVLAIIILIIIAGVTMIATIGFEFDLEHERTNKISLYLENEFEINDIKKITDEILQNKEVLIQKVEVFEDSVSIISEQISEEEKTNIINKVNEKYGLEIKTEAIEIENIPHTRGRDIVKSYMLPFGVSSLIILGYVAIKYKKQNIVKVLLKSAVVIAIFQVVIFCLMAIVRIPIGIATLPLIIVAYLISILGLTRYFEKNDKIIKEKVKKSEK